MRTTLFFVLVFVVAVSLPGLHAAEVPCEVEIVPQEGEPLPLYSSVIFSHEVHADYACDSCHHMFDGAGSIESCQSCHFDRDLSNRAEPTSYYKAWHSTSKISCIGCHRSSAYKKEQGGPVTCLDSGCHQR